jgi:hypothetical protein
MDNTRDAKVPEFERKATGEFTVVIPLLQVASLHRKQLSGLSWYLFQ